MKHADLLAERIIACYKLGADHLKSQCNGRSQHQNGDGCRDVSKLGRAQQPGHGYIEGEVHNAHKAGAQEHNDAAAQHTSLRFLLRQLACHRPEPACSADVSHYPLRLRHNSPSALGSQRSWWMFLVQKLLSHRIGQEPTEAAHSISRSFVDLEQAFCSRKLKHDGSLS